MKGSSLFSPSTWRKKRLQRTASETVTSESTSKPSSDNIWIVRDTYHTNHARSAINLRSTELSEDDDTPRPSLSLPKPSSRSAIVILDDGYTSLSQSPQRPQRPPSLNMGKSGPTVSQSHTSSSQAPATNRPSKQASPSKRHHPPSSSVTPAPPPSLNLMKLAPISQPYIPHKRGMSTSNHHHPHLGAPQRPPNLKVEKSRSASQSHASPKTPPKSSPADGKPVAPSLSRHHSLAQLGTPNQPSTTRLRSKASVPELDGVWKGFLEELEEDLHTLSNTHSPPTSRPRSRSNTTPSTPRTKRFNDLPPSPPFDKQQFNIPKISPLIHPDYLSNGEGLETKVPASDLSVSLLQFPTPPPLRIRKRDHPRPLELKPSPRERPFPSSPGGASSNDSTPVATPTTPTPLTSKSNSPGRTKTQERYHSHHASHIISTPERPIMSHSFQSDPVVQTKLRTSQSFYDQPLTSKRHPFPTLHRTTSSDMVSSSCTSANKLREGILTFPISHSSPSYLQSRGRKLTRSTYTPIQWGIAV
ncbi:hypothetical protein L218DRAFT_1077055 [Marasmius fiardii PR-910]|nr:hypothetical protein L218DRAFT_1077055 [Marasmius fiardii PR-910]